MIVVHVLGAGAGLPTASRDTTSLLIESGTARVLVDCPGSIVTKLDRLGLAPEDLDAVVFTHDHVDHVYGFPHLVHAMMIARQPGPLVVRAPAQTLGTLADVLAAHRLGDRDCPVLDFEAVPMTLGHETWASPELQVTSARAAHGRDTLAVRFAAQDAAVGYSADTRESDDVALLCSGVGLLLHDCGGLDSDLPEGDRPHASALECGRVAAEAGARELRLIHLGARAEADAAALRREAQQGFHGPVDVASDGDVYRIG